MNIRRLIYAALCLALAVLALGSQPAQAQSAPAGQDSNPAGKRPGQSLAGLLQPDGSLKVPAGLSGSFNVEGWKMALDGDGQPHFFPPQNEPNVAPSVDPIWNHDFMLGVGTVGNENDSYVFALAVYNEKVYVGGDFTAAGGVPAKNIACYHSDTGQWEALGSGVDGWVYAIAVYSHYVYVGGEFEHAGGISTGPLARWDTDTQTWSALGAITQDAISPSVLAITVSYTGAVYIGGNFKSVNGTLMNNIAFLDGSGWHSMTSGVSLGNSNTKVYSILISASTVYVGGSFNTAGGYSAYNLALWDGSSWHPVAGGVGGANAAIYTIAYDGIEQIYVGGNFSEAYDGHGGTTPVGSIAMWDGVMWSNMGGGVNQDVTSLLYHAAMLYVAGRFTTAGGAPARRVAEWTGGSWVTIQDPAETNDGVDDNIYAMGASSDFLFLGGRMGQAGDHIAHNVAAFRWNLKKWSPMGNSVNDSITALTIANGYLYVSGSFSTADNVFEAYLSRWNIATKTWYIVGNGAAITGCTGQFCLPIVRAIAISGDDIYIGGDFNKVGNLNVYGIARYNGGDDPGWHNLGSGLDCNTLNCGITAWAIAISGSNVYVGGSFRTAGGVIVNNVALWDGTWHPLSDFSYNGTNGTVYALAPVDNGIIVGGQFTTPAHYLALWNGANWDTIGNSTNFNGAVYAIAGGGVHNPLYVGGAFTNIGHVAMLPWLGATWQSLGAGLNGDVHALALNGTGGVFAGGDFIGPALAPLNHIAQWRSNGWSPLGSGTDAAVSALAVSGKVLWAGGSFTYAGNYPSYYLGSWNMARTFLPTILRK